MCNDATLVHEEHGGWRVDGDPTEGALLAAAARGGVDVEFARDAFPRVAEIPFDAGTARMTTAHRAPAGDVVVVCKGAPEALLRAEVLDDPPDDIVTARAAADDLAGAGYRVLAAARATVRDLSDGLPAGHFRLLGLVALTDPLRPSAESAVAAARAAGVRTVVITGDHPATVGRLARRLGILWADRPTVTGRELAAGDPPLASVYARVAPEQKLDVVRSWQRSGEVLAMTGDGVNDAPAMRAADIGVAMGRRGTEVAKQAADLVLTDDDLATVVAAVAEGRRVYDNIRRFVRYGVSGGVAEVLVMLAGPFLGLGITLLPAQILWINLLTHGVPGVALGVEPAEPDVLHRPPRRPADGILAGGMVARILVLAVVLAGASLGLGVWASHADRPWQSMVFASLALGQLWVALALRTGGRLLTGNPWLTVAVAADAALVLAALYLPLLRDLLGTQSLSAGDLGAVAVASLAGAVTVALQRVARPRRGPSPLPRHDRSGERG